jgi:hypothetical protein
VWIFNGRVVDLDFFWVLFGRIDELCMLEKRQ